MAYKLSLKEALAQCLTDRCRAGEEVQISYGQFSNALFYLFFGFVPDDNPWDSVTIFRDICDMVTYHDMLEVRADDRPGCHAAEPACGVPSLTCIPCIACIKLSTCHSNDCVDTRACQRMAVSA